MPCTFFVETDFTFPTFECAELPSTIFVSRFQTTTMYQRRTIYEKVFPSVPESAKPAKTANSFDGI